MTDQPIESDDQIVGDVLPVHDDQSAVPVDLSLQPWHTPRKQFIRERQWLYFAERLLNEQRGAPSMRLPEAEPEVRYLTLPGIDYLDVRLIGELCNRLHCKLTATGFLAEDASNPLTARAKVREDTLIKAGYISDASHTLPRRFEEVADIGGQAYREIQQRGAFHIVNIDACGSIAPPSADHQRRLIDAIHRVIGLQLAQMNGRWLLFLTTDARPDSVASDTIESLWNAVAQNADEDGHFREKVLAMFARPGLTVPELSRLAFEPGEDFLRLFALGFGKWALHLAHDKSWRMRTHAAFCYSTTPQGDSAPTMACLAFEFLPAPPTHADRFQVSRAAPPPTTAPGTASQADGLRVASKISELDNVDLRLTDPVLLSEFSERNNSLLQEAGYPTEILAHL